MRDPEPEKGGERMEIGRMPARSLLTTLVLLGTMLAGIAACTSSEPVGPAPPGGPLPAAPLNLDGFYYAKAVTLTWSLAPGWNGESFRIFGKRVSDPEYVLIAQVTNCSGGSCSFRDVNIVPGVSYRYYVAAVGSGGQEAPSAHSIDIQVPQPTPPPAPGGLEAMALDGAVYLKWDDRSRDADDFAFYRVYFDAGDQYVLMGETDSEGFIDFLVVNGNTYGYFVSAVDERGHESQGSALAVATPRPDYYGELLFAFEDRPGDSGFQFQVDELDFPIVAGTDPSRHFRLEVDQVGWWFVPGPGVGIHTFPQHTTALRCGPASDANCQEISVAPVTGYAPTPIEVTPEFSYVFRVPAPGGGFRYGVVRVTHAGFAQDGAIALFDWAFQIQEGNRNLAPPAP